MIVQHTTGLCSTEVLGAGVKSVNTRVVIGNKLNNKIFEVSHSAGWSTVCKFCRLHRG